MAGAWLAAAWLRLKGWRERLRLKGWRRRLRLEGCTAQRLMLKGWLRQRARLRGCAADGAKRCAASGCDVASSSGGVAKAHA